jgi:geranylgeranyl pyrophosphate synthase
MLTINKNYVTLPANNLQLKQKQTSPKLQTLNTDTVSFSGLADKRSYVSDAVMQQVIKAEQKNDRTFFKILRQLCEDAESTSISENADAYAQILKGEYVEKAIALLDLIEKDPETFKLLKTDANLLKDRVGIDPH